MILYSSNDSYKLYHGNMLDMLDVIDSNSVSSVVTDPPYELNFMGKGWDSSGIAFQKETWQRCYDALKPGGYLLAFGGSRTFHRIACAIEDAGFEIRDTIMWLYGSGFPKSMDLAKSIEAKFVTGSANTQEFKNLDGIKVASGNWGLDKRWKDQDGRPSDYSADAHERVDKVNYTSEEAKQWDGWGTALKPAYEPIIVARKPCEGTTTDNVIKYGVGGINIEECRIGTEERTYRGMSKKVPEGAGTFRDDNWTPKDIEVTVDGRFPSNVILTYDDTDFNELCGCSSEYGRLQGNIGNALRYFYCAKASKRDRDEGLSAFEEQRKAGYGYDKGYMNAGEGMFKERQTLKRNLHPTVKPVLLMQYLVRLVTPKSGIVLDPFNGSGSTGKAVMYENHDRDADYKYIGIELTEQYLPISKARIEQAQKDVTQIQQITQTRKGRLF